MHQNKIIEILPDFWEIVNFIFSTWLEKKKVYDPTLRPAKDHRKPDFKKTSMGET